MSRRFVMPARKQGKTWADKADGPGSPAHLMRHRVKQLTLRMRNTLPFPMPVMDFLKSVYPSEIFIPMDRKTVTQWANLLMTTNMGRYAHYHIEGRKDHETFWVKHPEGEELPTPADVSMPMIFDKENPNFKLVTGWADRAMEFESELSMVCERAGEFLMRAKHPVHVGHYWPELHAFVAGAVPDLAAKSVERLARSAVLALPIKRVRDEVTDTLAKCSLLPEKECGAWVYFPSEG